VLANVRVRAVWTATGNNIGLSAELVRRCVRIRLEPQTDRPEDRDGWRHPSLREWAAAHRGELVRAALILCRWWIDRGRPVGRARMGSFESYAATISGILDAAGLTGFWGTSPHSESASTPRSSPLGPLCDLWYAWAHRERGTGRELGVTAGDLFGAIAQNIDGLPLSGTTAEALSRSFGHYLRRVSGVYASFFDGETRTNRTYKIEKRAGLVRGRQLWRVDLIAEE
jgi:hypothetical protein